METFLSYLLLLPKISEIYTIVIGLNNWLLSTDYQVFKFYSWKLALNILLFGICDHVIAVAAEQKYDQGVWHERLLTLTLEAANYPC